MLKSALKKRTAAALVHHNRHDQAVEQPALNDHATTVSSTEDFGILQLGSSVTVNEDARRITLTEIQEIETSITATQQQVSKEDKTANELGLRRERTEWEVAGLREESHELLDQMTMNATILAGLDSTLRTQIIPPDDDDNEDDAGPELTKETDQTPGASDEFTPPPPPPMPVNSAADFRDQLQEVLAETDWMEGQHREASDAIQEIMQRKDDTLEAMGTVLETVRRDQLKVQLANAVLHKETAETTLQDEQNRLHTLEQQVLQVNERCAVLENECDKMAEDLEVQKKKDADKIAGQQKLMSEQAEELRRLEEVLAAIEKQNVLMDQQIAQVTASVEIATEFLQQRHQQTTVLEETRSYRKMLFAEYAEKERAIAITKENLEDRQRALHKATEEADKVAALKMENDTANIDELSAQNDQLRSTLASLEAVLEKLASGNAEDDSCEDVKSLTQGLLDKATARLAATDQELVEEKKIYDDKVKELEQHQMTLDEHRASHQPIWQSILDDVAAEAETEQALQQRLDESHRVASEALEWGRTLKVFRSGKELHKKMDEKERGARKVAADED